MSKANINVVGNNDNQELVKGIAFVKSRRAPLNVAHMVMEMNAKGIMEMFGVNETVGKIKELVEIVG